MARSAESTTKTVLQVNEAFLVHGQPELLLVDPRVTLLDALRPHLEMTGLKRAVFTRSAEYAPEPRGPDRKRFCSGKRTLSTAVRVDGK